MFIIIATIAPTAIGEPIKYCKNCGALALRPAGINNNSYEDIEEALAKTLEDVLVATEVPACNEVQCGWAASHSLEGAQEEAKKFLEKRSEWKNVFSK